MAVIDGVFYLNARVIYKRETFSVITLEGSEIMITYKTPDNVARNRRTNTPFTRSSKHRASLSSQLHRVNEV